MPSSSAGEALASLASYLGVHSNARILLESITYRRVQLPAPADLEPVEGEPPGLALLRRHQASCCRRAGSCVRVVLLCSWLAEAAHGIIR